MGSSLNFTVSLINHTVCHHKQFCLSSVNSSPLSERPLPLSARRWRPLRRRRLLLPFSSARPSNRDWQSPSSPLSPQEREKRLLLSFPVGVGPFRFLKNYNSDSLGVFMRSKNRFLWMSRDSQFLFWGNWLTSKSSYMRVKSFQVGWIPGTLAGVHPRGRRGRPRSSAPGSWVGPPWRRGRGRRRAGGASEGRPTCRPVSRMFNSPILHLGILICKLKLGLKLGLSSSVWNPFWTHRNWRLKCKYR